MSPYAVFEVVALTLIGLLALHRLLRHLAPWLLSSRQAPSACHSSTPGCGSGCHACQGKQNDKPH